MMEQPIKVTEWQQTYTYDSGIHSGVNTQVPSVSSKCIVDDDDLYGKQYTIKKTTTTTYNQGGGQGQGRGTQLMGEPDVHVCTCKLSYFVPALLPPPPPNFLWPILKSAYFLFP